MFSLDHAAIRLEDEVVWLGMAPIGLAWVFQAQVLSPARAGHIGTHTHLGCEIVGYTSLKPEAMPVPYLVSANGDSMYLRRVFYLSPDWDHAFIPDELPDDLVVMPDSIEPGQVGLMPWNIEEWLVTDCDDEEFEGEDEDTDDL